MTDAKSLYHKTLAGLRAIGILVPALTIFVRLKSVEWFPRCAPSSKIFRFLIINPAWRYHSITTTKIGIINQKEGKLQILILCQQHYIANTHPHTVTHLSLTPAYVNFLCGVSFETSGTVKEQLFRRNST